MLLLAANSELDLYVSSLLIFVSSCHTMLIDIERKTLAMPFLSPKQIAHAQKMPLAQRILTTISQFHFFRFRFPFPLALRGGKVDSNNYSITLLPGVRTHTGIQLQNLTLGLLVNRQQLPNGKRSKLSWKKLSV